MKRLTMDNIKEFVENKVDLEWLNVDDKDDEWEEYPYIYNKSDIIKDMIDLNYYFRYRIQEKKPMTITVDTYHDLTGRVDKYPLSVGEGVVYKNRQVIIID